MRNLIIQQKDLENIKNIIISRYLHSEEVHEESNNYIYGQTDALLDILLQLTEPINKIQC